MIYICCTNDCTFIIAKFLHIKKEEMIWNQKIFPGRFICIFPGLLLLEHLDRMMFVHQTWEMLSPVWVFLNRISWLVQVDQEELCRLREELVMGQSRAMHIFDMWKKVKKLMLSLFSQTCCTPLPSLSRKEPFMTKMWWQMPFFPSYYFRRASETPKPSSYISLCSPKSGIVRVVHIQRAASPRPVWSRRCNKTREPQGTQR